MFVRVPVWSVDESFNSFDLGCEQRCHGSLPTYDCNVQLRCRDFESSRLAYVPAAVSRYSRCYIENIKRIILIVP